MKCVGCLHTVHHTPAPPSLTPTAVKDGRQLRYKCYCKHVTLEIIIAFDENNLLPKFRMNNVHHEFIKHSQWTMMKTEGHVAATQSRHNSIYIYLRV